MTFGVQNCIICGRDFYRKRIDSRAMYCSNKCKCKAYRAKRADTKYFSNIKPKLEKKQKETWDKMAQLKKLAIEKQYTKSVKRDIKEKITCAKCPTLCEGCLDPFANAFG